MGAAGGIMQGVGAILGTVGGIAANISGDQLRQNLLRLGGTDPQYQANPLAGQRLSLAQTLLNARMPGAQNMERNIQSNQATSMNNIQRGATDGSQVLSMGAQSQGQTNQANANLGTQEQQDYYNRLGNLSSAQQGSINEGDKVYMDQIRRWQDSVNLAMARNNVRQQQGQTMTNMGSMWAGMGASMGGGGGAPGGK
ncbi:MAG TPA: hypothetical protein VGZ90_13350 [Puia sp.]|jgi:hypothetical protein|nr:hypothetical protein [Puia sp.]